MGPKSSRGVEVLAELDLAREEPEFDRLDARPLRNQARGGHAWPARSRRPRRARRRGRAH